MDETRGITVKIDAALHARAKADQEARELTMSQYITLVLEEHFNPILKGSTEPMNTRTMAFQIDETLFKRIKAHLTRTGLTQRAFVIGIIEDALSAAEGAAETTAVAEPEPGADASAEDTEPTGADVAGQTEDDETGAEPGEDAAADEDEIDAE